MRRYLWGTMMLVAVAALVIAGCSGDDACDREPDTGTFNPAAWDGTWVGQWLNQTFDSSGAATFEIAVSEAQRTAGVRFDMDGNVFGQADPPPIETTISYDSSGVDHQFSGTPLGDLAFSIDASGRIQGSFTNVPGAGISRVDFTGQRSGNTITINYTVHFSGGGSPASGVVTVTRR